MPDLLTLAVVELGVFRIAFMRGAFARWRRPCCATSANLTKFGPWLALGQPIRPLWTLMALSLPAVLIGIYVGWRLHERLSQRGLYRLLRAARGDGPQARVGGRGEGLPVRWMTVGGTISHQLQRQSRSEVVGAAGFCAVRPDNS